MTTERTPPAARRTPRAKPDPLRYSPAPGIRAWTALPARDQALLRWLLAGSVVTSELAALLAYGGLRTARRRLSRLVAEGLLRGYWAANSQRPRGRYAYSLVGTVREALAGRGDGTTHRRRASPATGTLHQLATHDLLAAFLRADLPTGHGLATWLPERAVAHLFDDYLRPDALAVIATPALRVTLFVERDLGTEPTQVLVDKVARYRTLLARVQIGSANLGIVVDSRRRARSLLSRLGPAAAASQVNVWLGVAPELLADPLGAPWQSPTGDRRTVIALPSDPGRTERLISRLCLLEAEGAEAFEPNATDVPILEPFLRHIHS